MVLPTCGVPCIQHQLGDTYGPVQRMLRATNEQDSQIHHWDRPSFSFQAGENNLLSDLRFLALGYQEKLSSGFCSLQGCLETMQVPRSQMSPFTQITSLACAIRSLTLGLESAPFWKRERLEKGGGGSQMGRVSHRCSCQVSVSVFTPTQPTLACSFAF